MFDRRLFQQALGQRGWLGVILAAALMLGLLILAQAWLLSLVIARVFLEHQTLAEVLPLIVSLAVIVTLRAGIGASCDLAANRIAVTIKQNLRTLVLDHLLRLGPAYTHGEQTGELTSTLTSGIEALDAYFSQYLPQLVMAVLVPLAILVLVIPLDLLSGIVLLLTAPLIPLFMILIGKSAEALTRKQFTRLSRLSAYFLDILQGLTTLKLLNQSKAQAAGVRRASEQYADATLAVLRIAFLSALVLEMAATLSTAVIAVEIGLRVLYGQLGFQPALFILILAPEFYIPLRMLGLRFHAASAGTTVVQRIMEILNTPLPPRPAIPHDVSAPQLISFHAVDYTYGDSRAALHQVTFEIKRGQTVALVGPSGAGKTTIANLLMRFIKPTSGEIRADGIPLRELDADRWRAQIGWVGQQPHLFHDTIAANLRLASPNATLDRIEAAARRAHLHRLIETLPQGYETVIGEEGARLSGGQKQRLALARALLKDAPLLILDEPTSGIDPETEALLQESTQELMRGRTVLIIAHRLATIYRADQIIVLDRGRVVELGTHSALLKQGSLYRQLTRATAPGYAL